MCHMIYRFCVFKYLFIILCQVVNIDLHQLVAILFAYGPADATATPKPRHLLPHLNPDLFYLFLVPAYPGWPGKEAVKQA